VIPRQKEAGQTGGFPEPIKIPEKKQYPNESSCCNSSRWEKGWETGKGYFPEKSGRLPIRKKEKNEE
jgi:hypothetical protein